MAGEAKTNQFLLSSATLMLGTQAELMSLNPAEHSVGLVKNFVLTSEPVFTELKQGVMNELVYSKLTDVTINATCEVYEFTPKNLAYGLVLQVASFDRVDTNHILDAPCTAADVTCDIAVTDDASTEYAVGKWIMIQPASGDTDNVHIAKITATSYASLVQTVTFTGFPIPTGVTFAAGSTVSRVSDLDVGAKTDVPFLSAKVVGTLPENDEPITILIPKIKIIKGFSLGFDATDYGSMPFELQPYAQISTDPNYSTFDSAALAHVMIK